ncbi:energy transducer TonB [Marinomonas balearica]|uniref:Protein TonB n=1 Tax=Marinomonas balearica TaxID=491947 RepID=A0A4R6MBH9_9GAMM|nr:energy transducer TonB [Marinomonas balearica]TDO97589.1 protein TonB [Marinomonas balearica]
MRAADRFSIALFIAITLHVVAVMLVSFDFSLGAPARPPTLEITLVQHKTKAPKEADFLAQANQLASGTEIRKQKLTSTETAQFIADEIQDITPPVQPQLASKQPVDQPDVIVSAHQEAKLIINDNMEQELKTLEEQFRGETQIPSRLSSDIASLEALLDQQRQAYAKRPRIRRLTSVSAKSALDAEYLDNWRKRIERIGNIHYPSEAKRQKLFGQLRLAVVLQPNGYVDKIDVLQSSGLRILDDAAMRIVRLSEPFAPFPIEMKKEVDKLEVIRTWKFVPGNQLQSR